MLKFRVVAKSLASVRLSEAVWCRGMVRPAPLVWTRKTLTTRQPRILRQYGRLRQRCVMLTFELRLLHHVRHLFGQRHWFDQHGRRLQEHASSGWLRVHSPKASLHVP